MNYTIELSNDEGERLVAGLRKNNVYGDGEALGVIQEAVSAGRLTVLPTAFREQTDSAQGYREVVTISELNA